jgi:hypothetical protein
VSIYATNSISAYKRMPYLVSVPMRYAFSAHELAVPRAVATADGLIALP